MKKIHWYVFIAVLLIIVTIVFFNFIKWHSVVIDSIALGFIASTMTVLAFEVFGIIKMVMNFRYLQGNDWKEYCSIGHNFSSDFDFNNETANVEIKYDEENLFNVTVKETKTHTNTTPGIWYGKLTMNKDNIKTGRVSWHYPNKGNNHRFGLKEAIVNQDDVWDYIYLMSINYGLVQNIQDKTITPLFGNVVLRRLKIKNNILSQYLPYKWVLKFNKIG